MDDGKGRQVSPCQSQDRLQFAEEGLALCPVGRGCSFYSPRDQGLSRYPSQSVIASVAANCTERKYSMISLRPLPPDACIDDPVANLEPMEGDVRSRALSMASHGITRIKEWATRGDAKQRALRHDLVTLCMCPQFLPCNMAFPGNTPPGSSRSLPVRSAIISNFAASGSWTALTYDRRDGAGCGRGNRGRSPARSRAHSPTHPAAVPQARRSY
jgi:hypothetical protein